MANVAYANWRIQKAGNGFNVWQRVSGSNLPSADKMYFGGLEHAVAHIEQRTPKGREIRISFPPGIQLPEQYKKYLSRQDKKTQAVSTIYTFSYSAGTILPLLPADPSLAEVRKRHDELEYWLQVYYEKANKAEKKEKEKNELLMQEVKRSVENAALRSQKDRELEDAQIKVLDLEYELKKEKKEVQFYKDRGTGWIISSFVLLAALVVSLVVL